MIPRAGVLTTLLGGAAVALALAWVVPPLAVVVAWPLLLLVPGWATLALLTPRLDLAGRVGVAVVLSVAISAHLVHWLSLLAGGYSRGVVFVALGLIALLAAPVASRTRWAAPTRAWRPARGALAVAAIAAIVVGGVLGRGLWRTTPTGVVAGGSNWSDLGVHLSIAETVNAGAPFPPDVPYFAGVPLVYHWFADLHAAILAEAAGIFSIPAMVVQSAVLAAALALVVHSLARRLLRGRRATRIATIASLLVIFGGGLGWVRLIGDVTAGLGSPIDLVADNSYDNLWYDARGEVTWPYFRIPSVMGTGLLAHRATTAGLPMLVASVLLLVAGLPTAGRRLAGWVDRPGAIALAGLLGALLAPFHFFFFPVAPMLALAWVVAGGRLTDAAAPRNAAAYLAPYALALPFVLAPLFQATGSGALQLVTGWPSAPRDDGLAAVAFFYLTNFGVPAALAVAAIFLPRVPHRGFLSAWLVGLFLIPNVVQVSVIDFDMNKYFQAMWIAVAILAAWLVRRWPLPAVAGVVLLSIPSPLLVAAWTATSEDQVISASEVEAATWVAVHTPPDAIFVTDGWVNSLTDAAGRRRLTTFGPYVANLGYPPDERIADVNEIYCGGDAGRSIELMRDYDATHLIDGARPSPCDAPVDFGSSDGFELVYDAGPRIWRLAEP